MSFNNQNTEGYTTAELKILNDHLAEAIGDRDIKDIDKSELDYMMQKILTGFNRYPNLDQKTLDTIATYMDDTIREDLHGYYNNPGEFLTAYIARDPDFIAIINQEFRGIL